MSTALTVLPPVAEAAGINIETWNSLTNSIYPGAKPESIVLAYQYCKARRLDVLMKPVHIVPMSVKIAGPGNKYEWRDVIMQGIHALRATASRTGLMAGIDAPVFGPTIDFPVTDSEDVKEPRTIRVPESCSVTVWRLDAAGVRQPYTNVEFYSESCARSRDGVINSMWQRRPHGQTAKCAEAGALRKGFPEELGSDYTIEEMEGKEIAGGAIDSDFTVIPDGEVSGPEEVAVAEPKAETKPKATKPKAEPEPEKKVEPQKDGDAKIDLPPAALRLLSAKLEAAGIKEGDLLAALGTINIQTVNNAFSWIKEQSA